MTPIPSSPPPGRLSLDADGIAWLVLDEPGKKVNTLSSSTIDWLAEVLGEVERAGPAALVIVSAKPGVFVAGADLEELRAAPSAGEVRAVVERGHALTRRLEALPCRTIAAIDGAALGGGLELALACRVRIATLDSKTRLGLPEVQLGVIPGMGGTQRLPRLVGVPAALDLILSGRSLDARRARRIGLVDEVVASADLAVAARALASGPLPVRPSRGLGDRLVNGLAHLPLLGDIVYGRARREVMAKTGGHYPAPLAVIEVVRRGVRGSLARGLAIEAEAFSNLAVTATAKSLIGIFFRKNAVDTRAATRARLGRPVGRIGVLGAGLMGSGIAEVLVGKGVDVVLKDRDPASIDRGVSAVAAAFEDRVRRRRMTEVERRGTLARLHPTTGWDAFSGVDLVIEAVFEDLAVKQAVIRELEAVPTRSGRPRIFASNTSTLPIAELAAASAHPERVVGMHFFSPVGKMPLLEVIRHPGTSEETLGTAVAVGQRMGKTVIVVNDGPGFFTSRVLAPFLNEAAWLLLEGARIDEIDGALRAWGWPVGPLTLLDEVGLDIAHHASGVLVPRLGSRLEPPPLFARMIAEGRLGKKAGRGFYRYDGGARRVDEEVYALLAWRHRPVPADEITERTFLQMLNEVARCLEEGIVSDPADVDLAVVFGFGFPPFRGGLIEEAERRGYGAVVGRLEAYRERLGERFAPAPWLLERAREASERPGRARPLPQENQ